MTGLPTSSPKSIFCRTRLSPPTFRQRNSPGSHQDNDDDSGKRLHRGQGVVPVVPKLKHALASIERAPTSDKYTLSKGGAFAHKNTMLRFVACVLIARQHDLCRTPAYRANVDYGRRAVRSPAAMSKMLANCEVVYIAVFWARANVAKASYFEGGIQCSRQSNGTPDITLANGW